MNIHCEGDAHVIRQVSVPDSWIPFVLASEDMSEDEREISHACLVRLGRVVRVLIEKRREYGSHDINRWGAAGVVVRLGDKYERIANLAKQHAGPGLSSGSMDESASLADAVLDLTGYAIILAHLLDHKQW